MIGFVRSLLTGIPLACLVAGAALGALTGAWGWLALGALAAAAVVAPRYLSRRRRLLERVARVGGAVDRRRLADLHTLSDAVAAVQGVAGAEEHALQLRDQLDGANAQYLAFHELLGSKFSPSELTFGRYLKSAEQVYLSVLDGIHGATTMLKGLRAFDLDGVRAQLRRLKRLEAPSEAERRELAALEERLSLREEELARIREVLSTNEQSLTALTSAGTALAGLRTEEGRAALGSAAAMRELEELVLRAERYSLDRTERVSPG